jgi:hypothetical protein
MTLWSMTRSTGTSGLMRSGLARGHGQDVGVLHRDAVFGAQESLQQHFERDRQTRDIAEAVCAGLVEIEVEVGLAARAKAGAGVE